MCVAGLALWAARNRVTAAVLERVSPSAFGLDLRVDGLDIASLSRIRVRELDARARDSGEVLRSARLADLEVHLDLGAGLRGGSWVRSVAARRASVRLAVVDGESPSSEPFELPAGLPQISILDLALAADLGAGRSVLASGAVLDARPSGAGTELEITAPDVTWDDAGAALRGPLRARLRWSARDIEVEELAFGEILGLRAGHVALHPDGFAARGEVRVAGGAAELDLQLADGALRARGRVAQLDVGALLRLLGADELELAAIADAEGSVVVPLDAPASWTADLAVRARDVRHASRAAESVEGRFRASAQAFDVQDALLLAGANAVHVEHLRLPRGSDAGCDLLARATASIAADLGDVAAAVPELDLVPGDLPSHRLELEGGLADGWIFVDRARVSVESSRVEIGATRVPAGGDLRALLDDPAAEVQLALRCPDVGPLARVLLPADLSERLGLAGAAGGALRLGWRRGELSARIELRAADLAVLGTRLDDVEIDARLEGPVAHVATLRARSGASRLAAHGSIDFAARTLSDVALEADLDGLDALGRRWSLPFELPAGRAQLSAALRGPFSAPEGRLEIDARDVAWAGVDARRASMAVSLAGGRAAVERCELELPLWGDVSAGATVSAAGGEVGIDLERLQIATAAGTWKLLRPARIAMGAHGVDVGELALAGAAGPVRILGRIGGGAGCVDLQIARTPIGGIARALDLPLPDGLVVEGAVAAEWPLIVSPAAELDGHLSLRLVLELADSDRLPLTPGAPLRGSGRVEVDLDGPWSAPRGTLSVDARDLALLDATGLVQARMPSATLRATVAEGIEVQALEIQLEPGARLQGSGRIGLPLDLRRLTRGGLEPFAEAPLALELRVDAPDLAPIAVILPELRRVEGALSAELACAGTLGAPLVTGRIALRDGGLRIAQAWTSASGIQADLALDAEGVTIERCEGTFGGAPVRLSGRASIFAAEPTYDLRAQGQSVPFLRTSELSVRSDFDLALRGPAADLELTGTLSLRDCRWERRLDLERLGEMFSSSPTTGSPLELPAIREPPFDRMRLRVDVRSDQPFRIDTPLLRAQLLPHLALRGRGDAPELEGTVEVVGGRVALPASKLELRSGRVTFARALPGVAEVDLVAEARTGGYDVRAQVSGRSDAPLIELSSTPPADPEDLALLLLSGRPPGSNELGVNRERVLTQVATDLARDLALDWFGEAGASFTDRIELATGADVSQAGADTVDVRFRLTGPGRGPGRSIYLRGERDAYDRVNWGFRLVLRLP